MRIRKNITDVASPAAGGLRASILRERQLMWPRIVAVAVVAAVLAGLAGWLRFPAPADGVPGHGDRIWWMGRTPAMPQLVVKLRGEGEAPAMREQVALLDPTPLFLATPMSSSLIGPKPKRRGEGVAVFGDEQDKWFFPEASAQVAMPSAPPVPAQVPGWVSLFATGDTYQGIGEEDNAAGGPLPARLGLVSVARVGDGKVVAQFELSGERGEARGERADVLPLAVMEFLFKVEPDGFVGLPSVITSSGQPEQDDYFSNYLLRTAWLGLRLAPGTYIVSVGP